MGTLIAYSSRYGTSEKVAALLAERLSGDVRVQHIIEEPNVTWETVDHVIVGSSIRMGTIQDEMKEWLTLHEAHLMEHPLALYLCAGTPTESERICELEKAYRDTLREHAYFVEIVGSGYDFERMGFLDKAIVRMMTKQKESSLQLDDAKLNQLVEAAQTSERTRSENP